MKLSEKGFEQASERGFGQCSVPKSAHPDPREAPVRAPPGLFRQFRRGILRSSDAGSCIDPPSEPRGWPESASTTEAGGLHVVVLDKDAGRRITPASKERARCSILSAGRWR